MFHFQNEAPKDPRGNSLPLIRTPANRPLVGIVTCDEMLGTRTHYYRGRTIPCDDQNCPACDDGMSWRWHAYLSVAHVLNRRQALIEFTAAGVEPFKLYREAYGTLRGCHFTARRAQIAANSRVIVQCKQADLEKITLPDAPNILEALAIIWNIELPAIVVDGIAKDVPHVNVTEDRALKTDQTRNRIRQTINGPRKPNGKSV